MEETGLFLWKETGNKRKLLPNVRDYSVTHWERVKKEQSSTCRVRAVAVLWHAVGNKR